MSSPYKEIIEGQTILRAAPGPRHELICGRLHAIVHASVANLASTRLLKPRTQVQLSSGTLFCPDLALVLSRDDLDASPLEPDAVPTLDDIAFVQFTSGSTSAPKGVVLSHRNVATNIDAINGPAGLATTSDDSAVSWLPLYHDMGLVGMALGPLYASRPVALFTPQAFIKRPADRPQPLTVLNSEELNDSQRNSIAESPKDLPQNVGSMAVTAMPNRLTDLSRNARMSVSLVFIALPYTRHPAPFPRIQPGATHRDGKRGERPVSPRTIDLRHDR